MRILHYFLGFPPYRSGGLTRFCYDLMQSQIEQGHIVAALWPGKMTFLSKKVQIKKRKEVTGIESYELINPLPVSLDEGIQNVSAYMQVCDSEVYQEFFAQIIPDVVHVHTLMGLHKEMLEVADKLNIKTVYTTHDYFGICAKVTLYRDGKVCDDDYNCAACILCNQSALSLPKIYLMQLPIYRNIKNSLIIKKMRKHHRKAFFFEEEISPERENQIMNMNASQEYLNLRQYYIGMLKLVKMIHFNSSMTREVYHRYMIPSKEQVITISNRDILDHRQLCEWETGETLRITCLAPAKPYKGYNVLQSVLDKLWKEGKRDFSLNMYGEVPDKRPYMIVKKEGFCHQDLLNIFSHTDVLVAPSVWYETFGYTVLEAISYGVPVIVSDRVGAKDIVGNGGIIVQAGSNEELEKAICSLNKEKLTSLRNNIKKQAEIKTWEQFTKEMDVLYSK